MTDKSFVSIAPYAVRPKEGARLAGVGLTDFYRRLNEGTYESFLDGRNRLVVVESIKRHQQQQFAVNPRHTARQTVKA